MQPTSQTISKSRLWTGRIISSILVLFLLFDAIAKLLRLAPVLQAFDQLGWSRSLSIPLGITLLTCTLLYTIPYTCALGALLLTAYLGGAVATHLRAGQAFYFPEFQSKSTHYMIFLASRNSLRSMVLRMVSCFLLSVTTREIWNPCLGSRR